MAMIPACGTVCFRNRISDEIMETLKFSSKVGCHFVELAGHITMYWGATQWLDLNKLKNEFRKADVKVTGAFTAPIPTGSEREALEGAKYINMVADLVAELGGELIVTAGGPRQGGKRGLENTVRGIKEIVKHIEKYENMRLCFETIGPRAAETGALEPGPLGLQICFPSDYKFLLENVKSDKVGICLDTGSLYNTGVDIVDLIHTYPDKIFDVHLKDHKGIFSVPIGEGDIDLHSIIQTLREVNYEGYLTMELERKGPENAPQYFEKSWSNLNKLLKM